VPSVGFSPVATAGGATVPIGGGVMLRADDVECPVDVHGRR